MPIIFRCTTCNKKLQVPRKKIGTNITCAHCDALIFVSEDTHPKPPGQAHLPVRYEGPDSQILEPVLLDEEYYDGEEIEPYSSKVLKLPPKPEDKSQHVSRWLIPTTVALITLVTCSVILFSWIQTLLDKREFDPDAFPIAQVQPPSQEEVEVAQADPAAMEYEDDNSTNSISSTSSDSSPNETTSISADIWDDTIPVANELDSFEQKQIFDAKVRPSIPVENKYIGGMAKTIGLNLFPNDVSRLGYLNVTKLREWDMLTDANERHVEQLQQFADDAGISVDDLEMITIGWMNSISSMRNVQREFLVRIKSRKPIQATAGVESLEIAGENLVKSENGWWLAEIDSFSLVAGTLNEVLYAKRFGATERRYVGLEWIDFSSVACALAQRKYSTAPIRHTQMFVGIREDQKIFVDSFLELEPSEEQAQRDSANQQRVYKKFFRNLNPRISTNDSIETAEADFKSASQWQTSSNFLLDQILDSETLQTVANPRPLDQQTCFVDLISEVDRFETYGFSGWRGPAKLLESIQQRVRQGELYPVHVFDTANTAQALGYVLQRTSSPDCRRLVINQLLKWESGESIRILGKEAKYFDLRVNTSSRGKPFFQLPNSIRHKCRYLLKYGGEPDLVIAACHVLADFCSKTELDLLEEVAENETRQPDVREAASKAIQQINGKKTNAFSNAMLTVADGGVALQWLQGSNRAEKKAGLNWVIDNEIPAAQRKEFVQALINNLDDGNFADQTVEIMNGVLSADDLPLLRKKIEEAIPHASPMDHLRQEDTLIRIVDLLIRFEDVEGLNRARLINDPNTRVRAVDGITQLAIGEN